MYISAPIAFAAAVTPNDATPVGPTRAIYVGTTGNLTVRMYGDSNSVVTFNNVPVGWHSIQCDRVMAATTAGNIVAGW